jgi:hypothetical protein
MRADLVWEKQRVIDQFLKHPQCTGKLKARLESRQSLRRRWQLAKGCLECWSKLDQKARLLVEKKKLRSERKKQSRFERRFLQGGLCR